MSPELIERLRALGVTIGPPASLPETGPISRPSPAVLPIEAAVPGRDVANEHGRCYVSDARHTVDEDHAGVPLVHGRSASTASLAALARDASLADVDLARAAYLDTETTGLAGGAGTYAFLIGIGRYVEDTFQVRQFFMRDPSEERAQLAEAADWLSGASALVTFNGKSFDVPLLSTRYALHRMGSPLAKLPHLDLLTPARRVWKRRLASCALQALEAQVFGLERVDDVPGWLVPERYFRYQQDGDARPLVGIFHHNALDVLTMVSLTTRLAQAYGEPHGAVEHGHDWLSLATQYALADRPADALAAADTALARGLPPQETEEAYRLIADVAKRSGDWPRALAAWSSVADSPRPGRLYPFEELAKYHEHQARAPEAALAIVERARGLVESGALRPRRGRTRALRELDHRLARLRRKTGSSAPV